MPVLGRVDLLGERLEEPQVGGAHGGGEPRERAVGQDDVLEDLRDGVPAEPFLERLADQGAAGGDLAGEDDLLGGEQVGEVGGDQAQVLADLLEQVVDQAIAVVGGRDQVGQGQVVGLLQQSPRGPASCGRTSTPRWPGGRSPWRRPAPSSSGPGRRAGRPSGRPCRPAHGSRYRSGRRSRCPCRTPSGPPGRGSGDAPGRSPGAARPGSAPGCSPPCRSGSRSAAGGDRAAGRPGSRAAGRSGRCGPRGRSSRPGAATPTANSRRLAARPGRPPRRVDDDLQHRLRGPGPPGARPPPAPRPRRRSRSGPCGPAAPPGPRPGSRRRRGSATPAPASGPAASGPRGPPSARPCRRNSST